jgi:hypothetical protein
MGAAKAEFRAGDASRIGPWPFFVGHALEITGDDAHLRGMLWFLLACVVLALVFLQRLVLPVILGFAVGTVLYLLAPMLQFEGDAMFILFGGMVGLAMGVIRTFIWLPGGGSGKK